MLLKSEIIWTRIDQVIKLQNDINCSEVPGKIRLFYFYFSGWLLWLKISWFGSLGIGLKGIFFLDKISFKEIGLRNKIGLFFYYYVGSSDWTKSEKKIIRLQTDSVS